MSGAKKEVAVRRERVALEEKRHQSALQLQRFSRGRAAQIEAAERRKRKKAAVSAVDSFVEGLLVDMFMVQPTPLCLSNRSAISWL